MLTGGFFVLFLRVVFYFGLPGFPCLHFIVLSHFEPMGSLWGGAVVVRGHPGDIRGTSPGFL